ncbi:uncharacterized protein LOC121745866 [Salvia splendens]|uniref:uncharacterized protein LOC121745866 n=1 Tax=Salvia splendens TaxID=180675 RepID=UPI001C25CB5F|nr:uncharacterized protein LOC121745866 [Salvia splendens]
MNTRGNRGNRGGDVIVPIEDHTSPYYLHPSDNPSLQLVSQVLIGSKFINWSRSVTTALVAKNKIQFVDGSLLRPQDDDLLFSAWIRCNSMVVSWLRNSVSPQICSSIMYMDNAHEIWSDLSDRFSQGDSARSYQLKQQLMALVQGSSDVNTYFTNLRIVWDEYRHSQPAAWCTCGTCRCHSAIRWHTHQEAECTIQFLIGLNPSYSQIRSTILSTIPFPSLSKAFSLVIQEERQRTIDGSLIHSPSISTSEQPFNVNAAASNFGRGRLICSHCGRTNHTVDRCFSLHGFPQGYGRGRGKPINKDFSKVINYVEDSASDICDKLAANAVSNLSSSDQLQQIISLLQTQLAATSTSSPSPSHIPATSQPSPPSPFQSTQSNPFTGTTLFSPFVVVSSLHHLFGFLTLVLLTMFVVTLLASLMHLQFMMLL